MYTRYAYEYNCPQCGCYDGSHFLILSFPASNREQIKTCVPDVFVLKGSGTTPQGGIPLRFALDGLIRNGNCRGMALRTPAVQIGTYERRFQWHNGNPYWYDSATSSTLWTAGGINRHYDRARRQWLWRSDEAVFYSWCAKVF